MTPTRERSTDCSRVLAAWRQEARDDVTAIGSRFGADIADPGAHEIAEERIALRPLSSYLDECITPMSTRHGEKPVHLLLFPCHQHPVVGPSEYEYLPPQDRECVDAGSLDRSYDVAMQDLDRDAISLAAAVDLTRRVTGCS